MSPASNASGAPLPSVAILGVDALLAARPATPVQLAHACQTAGYAAVYPVTWGDELLAAACMRRVGARGDDPAIFCACPHVSDALLEVGSDLARFLVPLVAPPVACARYLRALYGYNRVRITYIGACPGSHDPAIDATLTPMQFFGVLAQLGIDLQDQPEVFESVFPPDRRRHRSVPGGAPTSEMLAIDGGMRALEEIIDDDWKTELAQRLLSRHRALYDVAPALGCHCAGARPGVAPEAARPAVVALEPPRAPSDVIDPNVAVDVDRTLPAIVPRTRESPTAPTVKPLPDEATRAPEPAVMEASASPQVAAQLVAQVAAVSSPIPSGLPEEVAPTEGETPRRKAAAPVVARAAQGVPLARTEDGQVLPRAYAARRRTPPDGGAAVVPTVAPAAAAVTEPPAAVERSVELETLEPVATAAPVAPPTPAEPSVTPETPATPRATPRSVTVPIPSEEFRPVPPPPGPDHTRAAIATAVTTIAVALVVFVSLRGSDGRVTSESPGIAVPAPAILDSLPPLTFPLPDSTGTSPERAPDSMAPMRSAASPPETTPQEKNHVGPEAPQQSARPVPTRTRRRTAPPRRSRATVSPESLQRRVADSIERDAIRRELEHRRARLDSIARSLEPDSTRPDR